MRAAPGRGAHCGSGGILSTGQTGPKRTVPWTPVAPAIAAVVEVVDGTVDVGRDGTVVLATVAVVGPPMGTVDAVAAPPPFVLPMTNVVPLAASVTEVEVVAIPLLAVMVAAGGEPHAEAITAVTDSAKHSPRTDRSFSAIRTSFSPAWTTE